MSALARLRSLRDGWMGQGTLAPPQLSLERASRAVPNVPAEARISAGGDGSIIIEWESAEVEHFVSIERDDTIIIIDETPSGTLIREDTVRFSHAAFTAALQA